MALGTNLPAIPAIIFTYIEPVTLLLGIHAAFTDPVRFITYQTPLPASFTPIEPYTYILAYSLGSAFLLFALFSLLCTVITSDTKVTKYYLAILACGDMGHLYANYKGMGEVVFWDFARYNEVMWGNVGITVFLWGFRIMTLSGVFGRVGRATKK